MRILRLILFLVLGVQSTFAQQTPSQFQVKYVSSDVVYIGAGRSSGLAEGMRMIVKRPLAGQSAVMATVLAELKVISVASTSAACEIVSGEHQLQAGDIVMIHPDDVMAARAAGEKEEGSVYAQVLEFPDIDPLDQELREAIPKAPLPEINRMTGRISFEHDFIIDRSTNGLNSQQNGVSLRFDMTRIGQTYWSLGGYWRGRLNSRETGNSSETLRDVLQRVYQFGLRYEGPKSPYVIGIGRLLVPWASSLSTLDGGYFGRKIGRSTTLGVLGGTTPDPTSWNYDPHRQIGGVFTAFETGRFENARYTSTVGAAVSRLSWRPERQFLFSENNLIFRQYLRVQHDLEVDYQSGGRFASAKKVSLTRSFLSVRIQPVSRLSFDVSHNYFRVLPTFDPRLIGSGLVDNALFRGLSGSVRLELPYRIVPYVTLGTSSRSEDPRGSWNRMYGLLLGRLPGLGVRLDARYSNFLSTIGEGEYRAISAQKEFGEHVRMEVQAGKQRFASSLVAATRSKFVMTNTDWFIGRHFVLSFSGSRYRGGLQNYDQGLVQLGYRF